VKKREKSSPCGDDFLFLIKKIEMKPNFKKLFEVKGSFSIKKHKTDYPSDINKEEGLALLEDQKNKLANLQEKLYADGSQSLLIVLQAMDAAGKDSLIKHVFGGVNPQGCDVTSFKTPNSLEYAHERILKLLWVKFHLIIHYYL